MSEELKIKLLGNPAAFVGDEPLSGFVSIKAQALLFYLAATRISHRRDALAALLWSDVPDAAARKNLRDVLSNLRRLIGPFLIITRHVVGLDPDAPVRIDSQSLLNTLTAVRDIATSSAPENAIQTLAEAAKPPQGEFLAGFYPPDAPLFEEWMLAEREHLRLELGDALQSLTEYSLAFEDYAAAATYARRQLELDSFREEAHRQLLTALALSDRRAEAVAHYETLVDLLWHELGLEPAEKTQELIAKIQAGEVIPVTFAEKIQPPPDNLPKPLTPFVGREKEMAAIATQLAAPNTRLLTLHGPGGVGKTRLALEFARQQRGQYAEGIFFVPLASQTSPTNLVTTIAAAIGLQLKPNPKPLKQLLQFLQSRQILLLLDNFEHLKEDAVLLVDMLQAAPQLTILVTSRDRLQLSAENLFEVSGLRTDPANDETTEKGPEAVQMFEIYAQRVHHDFRPDDAQRRAIVDLCRLVEGMPLAIELAAARVLEVSPAEILQQIAAGSRLLEMKFADVPPRLRSVRASFNYSWELLNEEEQQALMSLSIFRGGCTLASATAVTGADSGILASLVDKSLLTYDPAAGRYHIHELIRLLAEKRLQKSRQVKDKNRKHSRHFLFYAWSIWTQADRDRNWDIYCRRIGSELDNCRIALERSLADGDTEIALQLVTALAKYLWYYGEAEEVDRMLEEVLTANGENASPAIRAAAYLCLADIRWQTHPGHKSMIALAQKSLALYQAMEDQEGIARALYSCGCAYFGNDYECARAYLTQSVEAYENAGIEPLSSLAMLSNLEIQNGHLKRARSLIDKLRVIYKKESNELGLNYTDINMARIYYYQGQLDKAQTLAEEALQYRRTHGPESGRMFPLDVLSVIALQKRQIVHAHTLIRERLRITVDNENYWTNVPLLDKVAEWLFISGHIHKAAFWLGCFEQARAREKQAVAPVAHLHYQRLVSEVRDALGEEAYTAVWEEGYAVPVEDALPLALQMVEQYSPTNQEQTIYDRQIVKSD